MKLIEILVVISILAVLVGISFLSYGGIREKAERAGCSANLTTLHTGFTAYYTDHGHWIQRPPDLSTRGEDFYDWIIGEMVEYGTPRTSWVCPTEKRKEKVDVDSDYFEGSYFPTMFGKGPQQPFKWAHQPWVMERRSNHGDGALLIYPGGTIGTRSVALGGN